MSESHPDRRERLFETLLDEATLWGVAPLPQARRAAETDADVASDLSMIASLQQVNPSRRERDTARARVSARIAALMDAEAGATSDASASSGRSFLRAVTAPPASVRRAAVARRQALTVLSRVGVAAVVAMALAAVTLAGGSVASAHALPESPLYAVKRADEALVMWFAWTNDSKGQALTLVADHRLTEAVDEANQQRTREAIQLVGSFDNALSQLIDLTAHAQREHADTTALTGDIQLTLGTERSFTEQADAHGQTAFANKLSASMQSAKDHLRAMNVTLPKPPGQNAGAGNGQQGGPNPAVTPKPTHTPRTDSGKPTPVATPVVTPAPTPTSSSPAPGKPGNGKTPGTQGTSAPGQSSG